MRLLLVFASFIEVWSHFPLPVFELYLSRNGLPKGSITRSDLARILTRLDQNENLRVDSSFKLVGKKHVSFHHEDPSLWDILGTVSGIIYWVTAFEKQLGDAIDAAKHPIAAAQSLSNDFKKREKDKKKKKKEKLKAKFYETVTRSRGDLRKAHSSFKWILIQEARRELNSRELESYTKLVSEQERKERGRLELVYQLTDRGHHKGAGVA